MTEGEIQKQIIDFLRTTGWIVYRINNCGVYDAKKGIHRFNGTKGLPDILAIRKDHLMFIECKSPKGKLRPDQENFMRLVESVRSVHSITARSLDDILKEIKL